MNQDAHNKLAAFIWRITDSCSCDVDVRGKYRDVISPMAVLRRLDALLEPIKHKAIQQLQTQNTKALLENTNNPQILLQAFQEYFDGFSGSVQAILNRFQLMTHLVFNPTAARGGSWT